MRFIFSENSADQLFANYFSNHEKWEYQTELALGGYGKTYLLLNKCDKKSYVLKRLRKKRAKSKEAKAFFEVEKSILQELSHPSIPKIVESGHINQFPFYIMEKVEGKTFDDLIFQEGKSYTFLESLHIVRELLEIVQYLHNKNIIHRDLRIPNILTDGNQLFVIDFGLATKPVITTSIITENPKKEASYVSDLWGIGHFFLFLLYSSYEPSLQKEKSWHEELPISDDAITFIKKLLMVEPAFESTETAISYVDTKLLGGNIHVNV
ncbi:protein kinase domain-containing protein [Peribacillus alkalitolerans]|uniref:protein kinase domain-containing protein n=1 Tax=Peribacillus alkalitolerans TaxID=1550385 RepID=UPI0013D33246|nr:protein kinase [Peribacillus alkalitolerans]